MAGEVGSLVQHEPGGRFEEKRGEEEALEACREMAELEELDCVISFLFLGSPGPQTLTAGVLQAWVQISASCFQVSAWCCLCTFQGLSFPLCTFRMKALSSCI